MVVRCAANGFRGMLNVSSTSTACRVRSVALVAGWSFTDDFAICVGGVVGSKVAGAYLALDKFTLVQQWDRGGGSEAYHRDHGRRWQPYW